MLVPHIPYGYSSDNHVNVSHDLRSSKLIEGKPQVSRKSYCNSNKHDMPISPRDTDAVLNYFPLN